MRVGDHEHAARLERCQQCGPVARDPEDHEVGPGAVGVQAARRRLGDPARRFDAGQVRQPLREAPGVGMVVGEARDHPVGSVGECEEARRREHAHLAHAAADELARTPGAPDVRPRPDDDRADRAREPLAQAEGDRIGGPGKGGGVHSQRHHRVEEAGAVDVEGHAVGVGDVRGGLRVCDAQGLAHRVGMRVLDRHEAAERLVRVLRVAERLRDEVEVEGAVGAVGQRADARPDDDGVTGGLVHDEMALGAGDRLLAAAEVRQLRHEVAHASRRDEEAGLLAEHRSGSFLERVHGRVVAEDVVADLGVRHRASHGGRRVRDGVGAQVDPGHGPARISRLAPGRVAAVRSRAARSRRARSGQPPGTTPGSDGIARLCYDLPAVDPWCSGPTCLPVTQEIAGSNPVGSAIQPPLRAPPTTRRVSITCCDRRFATARPARRG